MSTDIRPEVSKKNNYYIDRERYYELLHRCRQYYKWKDIYRELSHGKIPVSANRPENGKAYSNPTEKVVLLMDEYLEKINIINKCAALADVYMAPYIIMAVTKKSSYEYMNSFMGLAASKSTFYDRYRKFFWILDQYTN